MLGIYLHVPFCQAICAYCNFNRGLYDKALKTRYVDALVREILENGDHRAADSNFLGGGTPSLLDPSDIARLIAACRAAYAIDDGAEITLETNPETVTVDRLAAYRASGVNRLSFGAQTFDDSQLRRLGRIHDASRIGSAVDDARRAGIANVSLDLMFWLPGQSRASWLDSVERAVALAPEHLSFYLLELYPNAPLKDTMARMTQDPAAAGGWQQEPDDEAADMYLDALSRLDSAGYEQYEISNACRPGRESRHNLKYWTGGNWRGFGCGAHSTVEGVRWQNVAGTLDYVERMATGAAVELDRRQLSTRGRLEEALFTGLRLTAGIDRSRFAERYGIDPWDEYGERLADACAAGFVWHESGRFGLTRTGMLVANEVLATFV